MKNNFAIIPARGGSRRLKNKNFLKYKNKYILEHTIIAAIKSMMFDKIILSTDKSLGKKIAKKYNIEIHWRPGKLSSNKANLVQVCTDIIKKFNIDKIKNSKIACLYATAPERDFKDIRNLIKLMNKKNAKFAIAATKLPYPPNQILTENRLFVKPLSKKNIKKRKSLNVNYVIGNGSSYIANTKDFLKYKNFHGPKCVCYIMPKHASVDIDYLEDFKILKKLNINY